MRRHTYVRVRGRAEEALFLPSSNPSPPPPPQPPPPPYRRRRRRRLSLPRHRSSSATGATSAGAASTGPSYSATAPSARPTLQPAPRRCSVPSAATGAASTCTPWPPGAPSWTPRCAGPGRCGRRGRRCWQRSGRRRGRRRTRGSRPPSSARLCRCTTSPGPGRRRGSS